MNEGRRRKIEQLPPEVRKKIFVLAMIGVGVLAVFGMVYSFMDSGVDDNSAGFDWSSVNDDFNTMVRLLTAGKEVIQRSGAEVSEGLRQHTDIVSQFQESTTTANTLFKKIVEQSTADWIQYEDVEYRFTLKHPPLYTVATSAGPTGTPVLIIRDERAVSVAAVTRDAEAESESISRDDYFLTFRAYQNNTTTQLMFHTFNVLP